MPGHQRRGVLPRRRRRDDEGEDESSTAGDLDEFSMSEGSAISNGDDEADVEGSEVSVEEEDTHAPVADTKLPGRVADAQPALIADSGQERVVTDTSKEASEATPNGLQHSKSSKSDNGLQGTGNRVAQVDNERPTASAPQLSESQETPSVRSRREHLEYIRQRNSNPAFVPHRGGFFLHDDRSAASSSAYGRSYSRGRGRGYNAGYNGVGRGYSQAATGPTERQWAHDLHDAVNKSAGTPPTKDIPASFQIPTAKPATVAPNRTFSISTTLGNVTVQVFLPGMDSRKTFQNIVKKQHTLLPQHRPPLRRDKPVRISIPDEEPRYIFPSTERSFIFIPRAMRPNQQVFTRGRGRGSFHGSRRGSIMGSVYTPSVAMSRRSSLGGAGSTGIHTPTDGTIPCGPMLPNLTRPIVRMPVVPLIASGLPPPQVAPVLAPYASLSTDHSNPGSTMLHSPTVILPMHQPRPQKAVSVAEIEPPAVKAPQQQQEQPFHQQMPPGVSLVDGPVQQGQSQQNLAMTAPLSHIPEGAIFAQPFQPYPIYPQSGYFGPAYPGGPMVFHGPTDPYSIGMGGPVLPPQFMPGQSYGPPTQPGDTGVQSGAVSHETNGMVYYYDPSQFGSDGSHMNQYPVPVGGGMIGVPNSGSYYYSAVPGGMFYPAGQ